MRILLYSFSNRGPLFSHSAAALLLWGVDLFAAAQSLRALERIGCFAGRLGLGDIVFDFSCHGSKGRLYILALLSRCLKEANRVVVGHLLAFFKRHGALVLQIALVSYQDSCNVVLGVLLNLTHPGVDSVERIAVSNVVNHNDTMGALVVTRCNRLESLLASSVPDLQLADLLVDVDGANLEVDSDCWHKVLLEVVILNTRDRVKSIYMQERRCALI